MVSLQLISDFLKHRLTAKTRHGVHSPFVYQLIDEVIYDAAPKDDFAEVETIRKELLKDKRILPTRDLGAGSRRNNKHLKKISQLARQSLKPPKYAQLLYRLSKHLGSGNIIELGTSLGITTVYLSKARPSSRVITIEGCNNIAGVAMETFRKSGCGNIDQRTGNFDELFPGIIQEEGTLDCIFIDGNHRKEATLKYFEWCLPNLTPNSVLILDDIYWSKGMKEAWKMIKKHPDVTLTIDLFQVGLVFFRQGQAKEHFKVRF